MAERKRTIVVYAPTLEQAFERAAEQTADAHVGYPELEPFSQVRLAEVRLDLWAHRDCKRDPLAWVFEASTEQS